MNYIYITFPFAKRLKIAGVPQSSSHYYFNRTKEVFASADIPKTSNFDRLYTSAFVDPELDSYLTDNISLSFSNGLWIAKFEKFGSRNELNRICSLYHNTVINAKADLVLRLINRKIIKL